MAFSLARAARQQGIRRNVTLRPIIPTKAQATELARIMAPAWQVWASGVDAIMAGYDPAPLPTSDASHQFARPSDMMGQDFITLTDSPADVQSTITSLAAEFLTRLVTEITPGLKRWTVSTEQWHRRKWIEAVKAGTSVDLSTVLTALPVQETLETFVARNVALTKNISDQAEARIADAVFRGYQQRTPAREVAKEIREETGMARDRAVRIASDQSSKLSAALDQERQAEAGIEWFKWRHSGKLHPRSWHRARDGKIYDSKTHKPRAGGEAIPSDDMPGMPPWCGCRAQAYLAIMDEI